MPNATVRTESRNAAHGMLACVAALALIGLAAGVSSAPPGEAWSMLGVRSLHLVLGLSALLAGLSISVEGLRRFVPYGLGLTFLALTAMLISEKVGHQSHSAVRWIQVGSFQLQPSAFLQCLWPVFLASWAARDPLRLTDRRQLIRLMCGFGVLVLPVLLQPDLGSVLILLGVTGITLLFAGAPVQLLRLLVPAAIAVLFVALFLFEHVGERLAWWREPSGQAIAAEEAFAVGGLAGMGPGEGVMKYGHVPEGETDYILALIGEEWGLFGTLTLWTLFVVFTLLGVRLARRAERRYGAVLMASATLMISIQAALNMAVVTGAVPPKGLPLPFVSRGGTSILALSALLGLALRAALERRPHSLSSEDLIPWTESNALAS